MHQRGKDDGRSRKGESVLKLNQRSIPFGNNVGNMDAECVLVEGSEDTDGIAHLIQVCSIHDS